MPPRSVAAHPPCPLPPYLLSRLTDGYYVDLFGMAFGCGAFDRCMRVMVNRGASFKGLSYTGAIIGSCDPPVCPNAVQVMSTISLEGHCLPSLPKALCAPIRLDGEDHN